VSEKQKISVLMSVYIKENPTFLRDAINSIQNQTLKPSELVLVEDPVDLLLHAPLGLFLAGPIADKDELIRARAPFGLIARVGNPAVGEPLAV